MEGAIEIVKINANYILDKYNKIFYKNYTTNYIHNIKNIYKKYLIFN